MALRSYFFYVIAESCRYIRRNFRYVTLQLYQIYVKICQSPKGRADSRDERKELAMSDEVYLWRHGDTAARVVAAKGVPMRDTWQALLRRLKTMVLPSTLATWFLSPLSSTGTHTTVAHGGAGVLSAILLTWAAAAAGFFYLFGCRIGNWCQRGDLKSYIKQGRIIVAPGALVVDFETWAYEIDLNLWARGLWARSWSTTGTQAVLSEWFGMVEMLLDVAADLDNPLLPMAERTMILNRLTNYAVAIAEAESRFGKPARDDAEMQRLLAYERRRLEVELEKDLAAIECAVLAEDVRGRLALLPLEPTSP
jgi:hypothetical protein